MADLSPLLKLLTNGTQHKHVPKDQIILYEGDRVTDMLLVESGIIKMHDIDEQGNEKILHLIKPPGIIPFAFFSGDNKPLRWFYTALTDCELYVVPHTKVLRKMQTNPALTTYLMNWFSQEVHQVFTRLSSLGKTNARDKLVAALKFLAVCHCTEKRNGWWRVTFPITHQILADMTGVTRESVAVAMKDLQGQRVVRNPQVATLEIKLAKVMN